MFFLVLTENSSIYSTERGVKGNFFRPNFTHFLRRFVLAKLIKNVHFHYISGLKQKNQNPSHRHLHIKKMEKNVCSKIPPVSQKSDPKKLIEYTHMYTYMRKIDIMASWSNGQRVWLQTRRLGVRTSLKPLFFCEEVFTCNFFYKYKKRKSQHIY